MKKAFFLYFALVQNLYSASTELKRKKIIHSKALLELKKTTNLDHLLRERTENLAQFTKFYKFFIKKMSNPPLINHIRWNDRLNSHKGSKIFFKNIFEKRIKDFIQKKSQKKKILPSKT